MIGTALGFGGCIGRMRYFLLSTGLAVAMTVLTFMLVFSLAPRYASEARAGEVPGGLILTVALIVLPIFSWASAALAAKRFRDIGWKPLYAIAGWVLAIVCDAAVALTFPNLAVGDGQTVFGMAVNLAMVGSLLFWPGRDPEDNASPRVPLRPASGGPTWAVVQPPLRQRTTVKPSGPAVFGRR